MGDQCDSMGCALTVVFLVVLVVIGLVLIITGRPL
jgi:hypothetical protein